MDRSLVGTDQRPLGIGIGSGARRQGTEWSRAFAPHHHPKLSSVSDADWHAGHGARGPSPWRMRRTKARRQGTVPVRDCARSTSESPAEPPTPAAHTMARTVTTRASGRSAAAGNGAPWNPQT